MNEIYINGNLVVTEVGSSVTPQAEYVQDAWAIAGEPIQLGGDDITYRTPNVQPVKPTHPGFYWYKGSAVDGWEPISVYSVCRESKDVLRVEFIGMEGSDSIDRLTGEWGSEIVHE